MSVFTEADSVWEVPFGPDRQTPVSPGVHLTPPHLKDRTLFFKLLCLRSFQMKGFVLASAAPSPVIFQLL